MSAKRWAVLIIASLSVAGCGTYVPEIQEVGDAREGQKFVQAILTNITCEVQNGLYDLDKDNPNGTFLDNWGVQMTLTLQTEEKAAANPTVNWLPATPATALFNLGASGTLSSDATRIDKLNSYYLVKDLKSRACPPANRPGGLFLMQSDLKLKEWLYDAVSASLTNTVRFGSDTTDGPFKENVLSHEVKFEVISNGAITPTWKLTRVQVNPTGTLFSATRDRLHDLLITIGPADKTYITVHDQTGKRRRVIVSANPSQQAAFSHLASEIGTAVNGVRNGPLP